MSFERVVTYAYNGRPSRGAAKLGIYLSNKTVLVATDCWITHPRMSLIIHPKHWPQAVVKARDNLRDELLRTHRRVELAEFRAFLPRELRIGDKDIQVVVQYGVNNQPRRWVTFEGRIEDINPID